MSQMDAAAAFEEVSEHDSKAMFKPKVVSLVVSNAPDATPNVMTASWYMLAGYRPFRYLLAVSHKTHTYELIEANPEFVLSAPSTDMVDALTLAGSVSGRDVDKIDHLGLETVPGAAVDVPLLADAVGNVECTVMDSFEFEGTTYYFGNVERAWIAEGGLDGRILSTDADVLAYMGSDWPEGDGDEADAKDRYYADLDEDVMASYPGGDVFETLPEALRDEDLS